MKKFLYLAIALMVSGIALVGCDKDDDKKEENNQQQEQQGGAVEVGANQFLFDNLIVNLTNNKYEDWEGEGYFLFRDQEGKVTIDGGLDRNFANKNINVAAAQDEADYDVDVILNLGGENNVRINFSCLDGELYCSVNGQQQQGQSLFSQGTLSIFFLNGTVSISLDAKLKDGRVVKLNVTTPVVEGEEEEFED